VSIHNSKQTDVFIIHETKLHKIVILVMFETTIQVLAFPAVISVIVDHVPLVVAFLLIILELLGLFVMVNLMECFGSIGG